MSPGNNNHSPAGYEDGKDAGSSIKMGLNRVKG